MLDRLIDLLLLRRKKRVVVQKLVTHAATEFDAEAIMKLRKEIDKDRANRNPPLDPYGGSYPTVEQQTEEIPRFRPFIVAEVEQEIVGVAFAYEMHHMAGDYRLKVIVRKNWRNKGIGTVLVSQIIDWAKTTNTTKQIVCVFAKSHRDAKHMLMKLGFSVSKQGWEWYMQGAMFNAVEMTLTLDK